MKRYKITVNGQAYDVVLEEIGATGISSQAVQPVAASAAPAAPVMASAPAAAGGSGSVRAPMPGTVTAIKVSQGQKVQAGEVVLLLEAMKMENEIVAPMPGTVTAIKVAAGQSVNTNDVMVEIG
jgi:glutaconyl-CoA decarboxylase